MNLSDTYYKALREYKKITSSLGQCAKYRNLLSSKSAETEKITVSRNICKIDEEWIVAIEKGLVYIDKAIKEERQFIYSSGEVIPIELVKNVSRGSVLHLAKHSNLISKADEEIIPEKLFSVERMNDYAVYENRFLYMLLCYLRDFVSLRFQKLSELSGKYEGNLVLQKEVTDIDKKLCYSFSLSEVHLNDEHLKREELITDQLNRIEIILKTIIALLSTPLMDHASKAPLISPPITKTNILKMDNNFKGAVELYDFIISYDKDGYDIEHSVREISSFDTELSESLAEAAILLSFLTHMHGLNIGEELRINYETNEANTRKKELKRTAERLDRIKRRLSESDISPEEYISELQMHADDLRIELSRFEHTIEESDSIKKRELRLKQKLGEQTDQILKMINDADKLEEKHQNDLRELDEKNSVKINELKAAYNEKLESSKKEIIRYESELRKTFEARITEEKQKNSDLSAINEDANKRIDELTANYKALAEENRLAKARIKALCNLLGRNDDLGDFTDKENFDILESEFNSFKKFYKKQWRKTKKEIRKNSFKWENIKKQEK